MMLRRCTTCNQDKPRDEFLRAWRKPCLRRTCRPCRAAAARRMRSDHADRERARDRQRAASPERLAWRRQNRKTRWSDPAFRLRLSLGSRLANAIRRAINGRKIPDTDLYSAFEAAKVSAVRDLGCSLSALLQHLEQRFAPGMSWDNYGAWHVDHVRPLASFNLLDPTQARQAVHFSNLQPLWASENARKGARRWTTET